MILNQNEHLEKNKEQLEFVESIQIITIDEIEDLNFKYKIRKLDNSVNRTLNTFLNLDKQAPIKSKKHSDRVFHLLKVVVEIRDESYNEYIDGGLDYYCWYDSIEKKLYECIRK